MNNLDIKKCQILLVDDERVVLAIIGLGLTKAGYNVITAESVDEAESILAEGIRPDMSIIDISMPNRSGLDLAEQLSNERIPFMLLSAINDQEVVNKTSQLGALGYVVKPIVIQQLIPALEAALARSVELRGMRATEDQLKRALNGGREINIAIGIIIIKNHVNRKEAFELLRSTARKQSRKIEDIATELIITSEP
ncbi:MAG: response regulator [Methylotenera sp.]|nr:response regulator [Methylotenera sp.]MDP2153149.1 response regulator [Methylotenera sp.]